MASKFMRIRRIVIPMISLIIMTSQLTGCGTANSAQVTDALKNNEQVTIETVEPDPGRSEDSDSIEVSGQQYEVAQTSSQQVTQQEVQQDDDADDADIGVIEDDDEAEVEQQQEVVDPFQEVNETVYATQTVNIRSEASASSDKVGSLTAGASITRIGIGTGAAEGWSKVQKSDGTTAYISSQYLSTTKPVSTETSKPSTQAKTQTQTPKTTTDTGSKQTTPSTSQTTPSTSTPTTTTPSGGTTASSSGEAGQGLSGMLEWDGSTGNSRYDEIRKQTTFDPTQGGKYETVNGGSVVDPDCAVS